MAQFTTSAVSQASKTAAAGIEAVKNAAQSENAELSEMVIKGGGLVTVAVLGLTLYMNRKKAA